HHVCRCAVIPGPLPYMRIFHSCSYYGGRVKRTRHQQPLRTRDGGCSEERSRVRPRLHRKHTQGEAVQNSANLKWPVQQSISSRVVNNGRPAEKNCVIEVYVVVDIGHDLLSLSSCRSFGSPSQPRCSVSVTTQYADGLTPGSCL